MLINAKCLRLEVMILVISFLFIGKLMGQTSPWMLFSNSDTAMLKAKMKSPICSTQYKALAYGSGLKYALSGDVNDAKTTKSQKYRLMLDMPSNMYDGNKYGYAALQWGRRTQECVISLDRVINSPYFSQAEKDSLMRSCDSIAWRLRDTSYIEKGINNRSLDELMGVAFAGVFMFPNNPNAQNHYNYVLQQLAYQLTYVRKNDGSWPETARYVGDVVVRCLTLFSRVQRRYTGNNDGLVSNPKFASILDAFWKIATPKDVLNKNRRGGVGIGDADWGEITFNLFPLAASEMAAINNTQLSASLYGMWVQAGSSFSNAGIDASNSLAMIDTNPLIDTVSKLSSFIESDIGYYMFRKDYGQTTESYLITHLPSTNFYHRHADCGSFSLFANNTPLMLDAGVGQYDSTDAAWFAASDAHNIVCVKNRLGNQLDGLAVSAKIIDTLLSANYDYLRTDITPLNKIARKYVRNIGYLKPQFNTLIVYDYLDTDSTSVNNLHTLSSSTSLTTQNGFNRAISHGYNNMDIEITSLLPNLQIFTDTSRLGIPSTIPTSWPRNLANKNIATDKNNCYEEWLTINDSGFTQYLTIIKPHTKAESATNDSLLVTNNPSCLAYKVENGDTSKKYFIVLVNKSKSTTAQIVSFNQSDALVDLRTNAVYQPQNGKVQLSVPYAGMVVLIQASSLLPTKITFFEGKNLGSDALLKWKLGEENNLSHCEMEQSTDGKSFKLLTSIDNDKQADVYTKLIKQDEATTFYRLKVIDKDGSFYYSSIVTITIPKQGNSLQIVPNPTNGNILVTHGLVRDAKLEITTIDGKVVMEHSINANAKETQLNLGELRNGTYIVVLKSKGNILSSRIVKQ